MTIFQFLSRGKAVGVIIALLFPVFVCVGGRLQVRPVEHGLDLCWILEINGSIIRAPCSAWLEGGYVLGRLVV